MQLGEFQKIRILLWLCFQMQSCFSFLSVRLVERLSTAQIPWTAVSTLSEEPAGVRLRLVRPQCSTQAPRLHARSSAPPVAANLCYARPAVALSRCASVLALEVSQRTSAFFCYVILFLWRLGLIYCLCHRMQSGAESASATAGFCRTNQISTNTGLGSDTTFRARLTWTRMFPRNIS